MHKIGILLVSALAAAASVPAIAEGAGNFVLINGLQGAISDVSIRRAGGNDWKPLSVTPAPGARGNIQFKDSECAYDIRATVAGSGPTTWAEINLCDVKSITLKRDASAGAWVDYDQ